jgi:hypothetical protein
MKNKYHLKPWVVKIIDHVVMPVLGALLFIMMYVVFVGCLG